MVSLTNRCGPFLVKVYTQSSLMSSTYWVPLKWANDMVSQGICIDNLGPQALAKVRILFKPKFLFVHEKAQVFKHTFPDCFRGCV